MPQRRTTAAVGRANCQSRRGPKQKPGGKERKNGGVGVEGESRRGSGAACDFPALEDEAEDFYP